METTTTMMDIYIKDNGDLVKNKEQEKYLKNMAFNLLVIFTITRLMVRQIYFFFQLLILKLNIYEL